MITAALASSLGFMLPAGTPPNAIEYGTGYIWVKDMIKAGFALNIIGVLLVTIFRSGHSFSGYNFLFVSASGQYLT